MNNRVIYSLLLGLIGFSFNSDATSLSLPPGHGRFFLEGDGTVSLQEWGSHRRLKVSYRNKEKDYSEEGRKAINQFFGADQYGDRIALRLIALLDYLEDNYRIRPIQIRSGYRSPEENEQLRKAGKMAGKASLHKDGLAADLQLNYNLARKIWQELRDKDCCGLGFYHTKTLHLDTGKPRFWDETSSKTGTTIADHNKRIFLTTDFDRYPPGQPAEISFVQVTDYPFGVKEVSLVSEGGGKQPLFRPKEGCALVKEKGETFSVLLPGDVSLGRARLQALFCQKPFAEMPDEVTSNFIEIERKNQ
ncbi:MAG: DUF882 domain-containing protein [Deltaproteobacteria bacterium]|nr:DUF882 domain-containing protein [Deltaproteobacteria bacterium]